MRASLRFLLLEDNADDALLLRELLQHAYGSDMELDHAATATQATEMVQQEHYDLFLVDYMLGEPPNGAEWVEQMSHTVSEIPPVIMLTGLPDARQIEGIVRKRIKIAYFISKDNLSMADITQAVNYALADQSAVAVSRGTILLADDDTDDVMLIEDALLEVEHTFQLDTVTDGEALLDYLYRRGKFSNLAGEPLPGIILLDWNMPKKNGRQVLLEMRADARLRCIPVVVLSISSAEQDVNDSYDLGANSFVTKPDSFIELTRLMQKLTTYWFDLVTLP